MSVTILNIDSYQGKKSAKHKPKQEFPLRPLYAIATDIQKSWPNYRNTSAEQYVNALTRLNTISDSYGTSTGQKVIEYFLKNSADYQGKEADRIKEELQGMIASNE